jgi:phosphoenolpyruvate-protein kinase (PTS system EI component)
MNITDIVLIALIGAGSGLAGSLIASGTQLFKWKTGEKGKTDSDANKSVGDAVNAVSEAAEKLITPLNDALEKAQNKIASLEKTIEINEATRIQELEFSRARSREIAENLVTQEKAWSERFDRLRAEETEISKRKIKELTDKLLQSEKEWMQKLESSEKAWNEKFNSLRLEYSDIQKELVVFKSWAERLVHQVYSLGGEPVPMILDNREDDTKNQS